MVGDTANLTRELGLRLLRKLREIRQFEERIIPLYPTDVMVTPVHLHIGQEAVPVGVCDHLRPKDLLFFGHRTHGPALAKGLDMNRLMAELFGRTTGCANSFGGSMHLVDPDNGMLGSSALVGGGIALGVGAALAAKLEKRDQFCVSWFGDGAVDSGAFWESLNFAALKAVPVMFVCEDNGLSNVMEKKDHMFADITEVAGHFMEVWRADGTDVHSVWSAAGQALRHIRESGKPAFLWCRTKRWMKHQGVETDDLECNPVDREKDCPIKKLEKAMKARNLASDKELDEITQGIEAQLNAALEFAKKSPFPTEDLLMTEV
ncbi:MAG: dehydrogenase [Verrucomicrobia bacterium]|nr:MAG: dehydrogenase [Verrucomicrobiota bacterium]